MFPKFKIKNEAQTEVQEFEAKYPVQNIYSQNGIIIQPDHIQHSNKLSRCYFLTQVPSVIDLHVVKAVFNFKKKFEYTIKVRLSPINREVTSAKMQVVKTSIEAKLSRPFLKASKVDVDAELGEIIGAEQELANGHDGFNVTYILTIYADSLEELNMYDREVQSHTIFKKWVFTTAHFSQEKSYINSLPLPSKDQEKIMMFSPAISQLILPTTDNRSGIYLMGVDKNAGIPYFFDLFRGDRTHNITVTGKTGSGKSALLKKMFEEYNLFGIQRFVIDPEGEYRKVGKLIGATIHYLNRGKGINPIYYDEDIIQYLKEEDKVNFDPKNDHILLVVDFFLLFPFIRKEIGDNTIPLIESLGEFYSLVSKEERHLPKYLEFLKLNQDRFTFYKEFKQFEVGQPFGGYFSSTGSYELENEAIIFDLKGVENETIKTAMMFLTMAQIKNRMFRADKPRACFVDEFHLFLMDIGIRNQFIELSRRIRKYNAFFVSSTQEIQQFIDYDARSLIWQAGYNILFRQSKTSEDILKLTDDELNRMYSLGVGECFIAYDEAKYRDHLKVHLRKYQINYCEKDNSPLF